MKMFVLWAALLLAGCSGPTAWEAVCDGTASGDGFVGGGGKLTVVFEDDVPVAVHDATVRAIDSWQAFSSVRYVWGEIREDHDPNVLYVATCDGPSRGDTRFAFARNDTGIGWVSSDLAELPQSPERLELIAAHEMGHLLGLGHGGCPESVMCEGGLPRQVTDADRAAVR